MLEPNERPIAVTMDQLCERFLFRLGVFTLFATCIFILQGWSPNLVQDHIFYFLNADALLKYYGTHFPNNGYHQYWRGYSDNLSLSVILAYLYAVTRDHVVSCKIVLWTTTICYCMAFQLFSRLFVPRSSTRVFLTILSAFFISYGPTFWGYTDFQATLARSLVVPIQVALLYFYFLNYNQSRRILVLPALAYSSLIHLSGFHLIGVLICLESLRLLRTRGARAKIVFLKQLSVGIICTFLVLFHLANCPSRSSVSQFMPFLCFDPLPPYGGPPPETGNANGSNGSSRFASANAGDLSQRDERPLGRIGSKEAWAIEMTTARWRNFPPPSSTLLIWFASAGLIGAMALWGLAIQRKTGHYAEGEPFRMFALATIAFALGPQCLMFVIRQITPIYPHNIEECRSIMYITLPLLYYFYQLLAHLRGSIAQFSAVCLFLLQPIFICDHLPIVSREWIFRTAQTWNIIDLWESPRTEYARQVMRLEDPSRRFYYSCEDIFEWLRPRVRRSTLIVSNRPEMILSGARVIGSPFNMIELDPNSTDTMTEQALLLQINREFKENHVGALQLIAGRLNAKYLILPGSGKNPEFQGKYFYVEKVEPLIGRIIF